MKRIVIIGATSGIGKETALLFTRRGWRVGAAGRRENLLMQLKASMPTAFETPWPRGPVVTSTPTSSDSGWPGVRLPS